MMQLDRSRTFRIQRAGIVGHGKPDIQIRLSFFRSRDGSIIASLRLMLTILCVPRLSDHGEEIFSGWKTIKMEDAVVAGACASPRIGRHPPALSSAAEEHDLAISNRIAKVIFDP